MDGTTPHPAPDRPLRAPRGLHYPLQARRNPPDPALVRQAANLVRTRFPEADAVEHAADLLCELRAAWTGRGKWLPRREGFRRTAPTD